MAEAENLIMAVEQYPCLWDINNADYHNRDVKDLAWEQICKMVFNDWEICTDKANKCADLKRKWTNIRDYYRKELQKTKNIPTGSAAKKSKTYIYSHLLYFLTPIFAKRESEGNYPKEDPDCTQPQQQATNEEQNIETEDINCIESPVQPTPVDLPVVKQKRKKDVPTQILNMLQQRQKTSAQSFNTDEDDDTKFLLSFRTYMRKMNDPQKINFQLGMLQLVKNVMTGNDPSYTYCDNSSGSLSSPRPGPSSHTPVPQSSSYNISSPSPTYVPSLQRHVYLPQNSPIYYKSPSPSEPNICLSSQPQQQNVPCTSTSKPKLVIHSVSNVTPSNSTTQQNPVQDYPVYTLPENSSEENEAAQFVILQSEGVQENKEAQENNEAAQFLIHQSEGTREGFNNIHNYLKFK